MLSIKPTTSPSKDPDPASSNLEQTQVLFVQDEPIKQNFQMAKRQQGGSTALEHPQTNPKEATQDVPTPALSDNYKKALQNQTNINDQDTEGDVNILEDAIVDQVEQDQKQVIHTLSQDSTHKKLESTINNTAKPEKSIAIPTLETTSENILKTVIQEKMQKIETTDSSSDNIDKKELLQTEPQKVISKKHRPADLGQENLSKVQLSKHTQDVPTPKKKISLQDLQNGFSQFVRNGTSVQTNTVPTASALGNSLFFSSDGNSDKDDIAGLKRASYMHQIGQMYQNAGREYIDKMIQITRKEGIPLLNNYINITIERSGKISNIVITQSCGHATIDNYHVQAIHAIGDFPPIPKYIEAPMHITAYLPFESIKMIPGRKISR